MAKQGSIATFFKKKINEKSIVTAVVDSETEDNFTDSPSLKVIDCSTVSVNEIDSDSHSDTEREIGKKSKKTFVDSQQKPKR